jgi:Ricin-type beta-trefoil lectin domain-like
LTRKTSVRWSVSTAGFLGRYISVAALSLLQFTTQAQADYFVNNYVTCNMQIASGINPNLCVSYSSTNDGSDVLLLPCSRNANQNWSVRLFPSSGIWFETVTRDKVLEVSNWNRDPRGRVQIWGLNTPTLRSSQMWNIVPTVLRTAAPGSFFVNILNENSELCLDITEDSVAVGTRLWQWACNGSEAQIFILNTLSTACPDPQIRRPRPAD